MDNDLMIFGGKGQHAQDLKDRGIFSDLKTQTIEIDDVIGRDETNAVIVTISKTREVINQIISINTDSEIINFSGIMSTTPKDLRGKDNITNLHYMFGPRRMHGLKLIYNGGMSSTVRKILENSKKLGIDVISASIEEHDKCVAITQALSHIFILLSGVDEDNSLTVEWNTPASTIADMILENSIFIDEFSSFLGTLKVGDDLTGFFLDQIRLLSKEQEEIFSTPNYLRVLEFCRHNQVIVNQKMIEVISSIHSKELFIDYIKNIKERSARNMQKPETSSLSTFS